MSQLLIVKSGNVENPVLRKSELDINELKPILGNRKLIYLGPIANELPPLGQTSNLDEVREPDSVVVVITDAEAKSLNQTNSGFYFVNNLHPSDILEASE